ncbi:type IV secretory system conjugative DNA transfer family protein [Campylobacter concisus]|uniref:type IV secretory system conjugative DNA transfer family protein n=1 Tax=Campylobacter concisus TaxID=199 RepID=UPI003D1FA442
MGWITHKTQERLQHYFIIEPDKTCSGVISSFNAQFLQYKPDYMRSATSLVDDQTIRYFNFADLRKHKISIYVGSTP